jgi:hypothetical protein
MLFPDGKSPSPDLRKWPRKWVRRLKEKLEEQFPDVDFSDQLPDLSRPGPFKQREDDADFIEVFKRYESVEALLKKKGLNWRQDQIFGLMRECWPVAYGDWKDSTLLRYRRLGKRALKAAQAAQKSPDK